MNYPWTRKPTQREAITAHHGKGFFQKIKEATNEIGQTSNRWTAKLPHPNNMSEYAEWGSDPQVRIGIDLLTDMVAGSGYYTQMPEKDMTGTKIDPAHKNLQTIDNYLKTIGFRDKYKQIQRTKFEMGFSAVEIKPDGSLKILPSQTIYIWRDKFGNNLRFTQEYDSTQVAEWKGDDPNFLLFIHNEDPAHPYGRSITDSIGGLIDANDQINVDMPKIIHRYSSPLGIWEASRDIAPVKQAVTDRDVDEDVFIGNVEKDELRHTFVEAGTQVKFLDYIDQINFQIGQALHAPLILLLKNATEASATKMLDAVDRAVVGEQEQNADIIEKYLFAPLCGEPVPEFMHGASGEVLDEIALTDIGTLKGNGTITWKQAQDLIRKKGIDLIEDEQPAPPPIVPFGQKPSFGQQGQQGQQGNQNPFEKPKLAIPAELLIEKLNDLNTGLEIIATNFDEGKLPITNACQMAERTIKAHMQRAYPVGWEGKVQDEFQRFVSERIVKHGSKPTYRVTVD